MIPIPDNPIPDNPIIVEQLENTLMGNRRRLDWHQIFIITEGQGICEIDYEKELVANRQVINIPKGAIFKEEFQNCKGYSIIFLEEFFTEAQRILLEAFVQYIIFNRKLSVNISPDKIELLEKYIQLILLELEFQGEPNRLIILQNLMLALFNRLEGLVLQKDSLFITHRSIFQHFVQLLNNHYVNHKAVHFYTDALNITAKNLNRILKDTVGKSAQEFISEKVLIEAKRLLCFTPESIKEISFTLGFDNPNYFSRFFKSKTNASPEEFRSSYAI